MQRGFSPLPYLIYMGVGWVMWVGSDARYGWLEELNLLYL